MAHLQKVSMPPDRPRTTSQMLMANTPRKTHTTGASPPWNNTPSPDLPTVEAKYSLAAAAWAAVFVSMSMPNAGAPPKSALAYSMAYERHHASMNT